jgi:ribose transport system ATP-binding protein
MLELRGITKVFPGVKALDNVSVTFRPGEIHALVGENGAGKSTLMKIITGIYQPDAGVILLDGTPVRMKSFQDAIRHDINMVSQEIQVIPEATVAENIVLDRIDRFRKGGRVNWRAVNETAQRYLEMVGLTIRSTDRIGGLTAAQKQLIQIAKALSSNARYILMDEPTSSLTRFETENLMNIIRRLRDEGVCVIFISHKIEEVLELCGEVTVLRDGCYAGNLECASCSRQDIVRMMIGREEETRHLGFLEVREQQALEVRNLTTYGQFQNLNFQLKKGEILGFYGLVGSGRTELARQLIGVDPFDKGEIVIDGKRADIRSMKDSLERYRMGYVTENRKEEGLILSDSVAGNVTITVWKQICNRLGKINYRKDSEIVDSMCGKMEVKTPSTKTKVGSLSGGNQQKVSIAKWLAAGCDILIIDEPTVGVDVGAKQYIHDLIWQLAKNEGRSIILISSDMAEMITLARRILVFKDFRIIGEIDGLNEQVKSYGEVSAEIGRLIS